MPSDNTTSLRKRLAVAGAAALISATTVTAGLPQGQFVQGMARPIVAARIDPIVGPGKVASHAHIVYGASNFRSDLNSNAQMLSATCASYSNQKDKSNYWAPLLYLKRPDGKFEPVAGGIARMYYQIAGDNVQPFPEGLRMIAGTAGSRNQFDERARTNLGHEIAYKGQAINTHLYLPNSTNAPNGADNMRLMVEFPSCGWANQSLDSWDHWSHMTWPVKTGGGQVWQDQYGPNCPPSHPIKYPHMHLEIQYLPSPEQQKMWNSAPGAINYVLSNGDTTGLTYHADFVNGWDTDVLTRAIKQCGGTGNIEANSCSVWGPYLNSDNANCRYQGTIPNEELGYFAPLDNLPGCNPIWDANGPETKPKDCPWFKGDPDWITPSVLAGNWAQEIGLPAFVEYPAGSEPPLPSVGDRPYSTPWGVSMPNGRFAKFNSAAIMNGTTAQLAGFAASEGQPQQVLANMADTSVYTQVANAVAPENKWQATSLAMTDTTWLPDEQMGQHRPTGRAVYQAPYSNSVNWPDAAPTAPGGAGELLASPSASSASPRSSSAAAPVETNKATSSPTTTGGSPTGAIVPAASGGTTGAAVPVVTASPGTTKSGAAAVDAASSVSPASSAAPAVTTGLIPDEGAAELHGGETGASSAEAPEISIAPPFKGAQLAASIVPTGAPTAATGPATGAGANSASGTGTAAPAASGSGKKKCSAKALARRRARRALRHRNRVAY